MTTTTDLRAGARTTDAAPARVEVVLPPENIAQLAAHAAILHKTANALQLSSGDGLPLPPRVKKLASEALAVALCVPSEDVNALPWPTTPDDIVNVLRWAGYPMATAKAAAAHVAVRATIRHSGPSEPYARTLTTSRRLVASRSDPPAARIARASATSSIRRS